MKSILFYGDGNTWGYDTAAKGRRFPLETRFTGILMKRFPQFHIVEEGLPYRTTAYDIFLQPDRNGLKSFPMILASASPLDLIVLMLGTNDCRTSSITMAQESAAALEQYIRLIRSPEHQHGAQVPEILLIAPPPIHPRVLNTQESFYYSAHSFSRSEDLSIHYSALASREKCYYLDAAEFVEVGLDGIHLDAKNHEKLASAIADKLLQIFPECRRGGIIPHLKRSAGS